MKSFIDSINDSRMSNIEDPMAPLDNIPVFMPETRSALKGKQTSFGQGLNCEGHSKVFVLWRPWTTCTRCLKGVEHGLYELPEEGDHECPHTSVEKFEDILNKGLRGDVLFQTQEYFTLQDGTRCCHMVWLTTDKTATEMAAKKQETKELFSAIHSERLAEMKKEALEASNGNDPRD